MMGDVLSTKGSKWRMRARLVDVMSLRDQCRFVPGSSKMEDSRCHNILILNTCNGYTTMPVIYNPPMSYPIRSRNHKGAS